MIDTDIDRHRHRPRQDTKHECEKQEEENFKTFYLSFSTKKIQQNIFKKEFKRISKKSDHVLLHNLLPSSLNNS